MDFCANTIDLIEKQDIFYVDSDYSVNSTVVVIQKVKFGTASLSWISRTQFESPEIKSTPRSSRQIPEARGKFPKLKFKLRNRQISWAQIQTPDLNYLKILNVENQKLKSTVPVSKFVNPKIAKIKRVKTWKYTKIDSDRV